MSIGRIVEYVYFFALLVGVGYLAWLVFSPFISALALSLITVAIAYPLHEYFQAKFFKERKGLAALFSTLVVVIVVIIPLLFIVSVFVREFTSFYQALSNGNEVSIEHYLQTVEDTVRLVVPEFDLDLSAQVKESAEWFVKNLGSIFAGTITTIFMVFISLVASFYFFKDGKELLKVIAKASPLPDREDAIIFSRIAQAMRSVAVGVVLVSIIQGVVAAIGFTIFGIDRAILWGAIAALLAMLPGIGTSVIMIPAIIYLFVTGSLFNAIGLLIWSIIAIIVIDNIVGPQLMSRGNNLHPLLILLSVLGGISMFGPLGFIIGPVIITLFMVLLEIYNQYIVGNSTSENQSRKNLKS